MLVHTGTVNCALLLSPSLSTKEPHAHGPSPSAPEHVLWYPQPQQQGDSSTHGRPSAFSHQVFGVSEVQCRVSRGCLEPAKRTGGQRGRSSTSASSEACLRHC